MRIEILVIENECGLAVPPLIPDVNRFIAETIPEWIAGEHNVNDIARFEHLQ